MNNDINKSENNDENDIDKTKDDDQDSFNDNIIGNDEKIIEESNSEIDNIDNDEFSKNENFNGKFSEENNNEIGNLEKNNQEQSQEEKKTTKDPSEEEIHDIYRNLVEGALYAAGKSLSIEEISTKLNLSKIEIEDLLNELLEIYHNRSSAITIIKLGDKYQMQIKTEYAEKISQFAQGGAISEKYLRTLTIIALKQPILKSLVIKIRGTGAYEHIKFLEENGFIVSGKKGRSAELITTDKYAEMFGLPKDKQEMKKVMIEQLGIEKKSN
ncbi:MAG: SMC-Scp complex subunit ScpB [Candidatus Lokiarchaeota archaeon]|nr:SMC-Scp complex subunit ScpB [Candidatus Lokiarchaeota archaeon]